MPLALRLVLFFLLTLILSPLSPAHAQERAEWGEVPRADLEMTAFPADSNATAVILSDYGKVRFRFNGELKFERHRRIKILTENGYDWGTVKIPFYDENDLEDVDDIEAQTFTLGPDGDIQRHEMDGDAIFEEDIDGSYRRMRFTLPALEPGAVIEYRYEIEAKSPLFLRDWAFQTSEPTRYSEYEARVPNVLDYVMIKRGSPRFVVDEEEQVNSRYGTSTKRRWAMQNVPALREEPFMTTTEDYRAQLRFQLRAVHNRRTGRTERLMTTWPGLAKDLMDDWSFGRELERHGDVRDKAEALAANQPTLEAKMEAIYDYVRTGLTWTGEKRIFLEHELDDVLDRQQGSSAELNMLLVSMLRSAGIEAHPVLISTRDHGRVMTLYPFMQQFNDVIAVAQLGDQRHYLDATDPLRPAGLLPARALNRRGWLVNEERPRWIEIPPTGGDRRRLLIRAELKPDGTVEGTVEASDYAYAALEQRRTLQDETVSSFVRSALFDGRAEAVLTTPTAEHQQNLDKPLVTKASFRIPAYAQRAGGLLYVNPIVLDRLEENPFRQPERSFPVDFAHPRQWNYTIALKLPDGYVVEEVPENMRMRLPSKEGSFDRVAQISDNFLSLRAQYVIAKPRFEPGEYQALRNLYSRIVSACTEPLVLKKQPDEEAALPDEQSSASSGSDSR